MPDIDVEIAIDSDLGRMASAVYAEMEGGDFNSKLIVAESIKNRTELSENLYEHAETYEEAIDAAYDVSDPGSTRFDEYTNPINSYDGDPLAQDKFVESMSAAIKTHYGTDNSEIGQGVIFYNSSNATIYDNNPGMEKIILNIEANGIAGAWKLEI